MKKISSPTSLMDADDNPSNSRRRWLTCAAVIVLLILFISILGATVFRARKPITTINSVAVRNFDVSFDPLRLNVHLNVSLDVDLTVKNPNKVGFKYTDSSAYLDYRGQVVGQAPIPAGQISAGQTLPMHVTLTVMAERLLSNSQAVISDVVSGTLPLTTRMRISGKVKVVFVKVHVVSYATCNMNISISSKSLLNNDCTYDTRLS